VIFKGVIPEKAVRLRRTELLEFTGFRLEFIPMKIGAGMTEKGAFGLFTRSSMMAINKKAVVIILISKGLFSVSLAEDLHRMVGFYAGLAPDLHPAGFTI